MGYQVHHSHYNGNLQVLCECEDGEEHNNTNSWGIHLLVVNKRSVTDWPDPILDRPIPKTNNGGSYGDFTGGLGGGTLRGKVVEGRAPSV